ncbi:S8 family peptidase [Pseudochryseolinea flava]|uniref:Peptidase S8/S53 domain-containing protein n=1 Tax=Pseudochryseolinea flava TaxID=2059302 RepID=A0A364Y3T5_9BACT|nr:S8/S53 family peptidase [Pseudochryseolinea flava]RAW00848.1 hypothetical protein DQQ10_11425 [Pseudochryseolinea flava]
MMQVRVTKYLNLRTDVPEILPNNNPGFFVPNDTITIVDTVKGQDYKGNDVWYKVEGGGFVWSGAVDKQILSDALDWWHTAYNIVDVWNEFGTWGKGVKVAVIDSGVDLTNPFLDPKLIVAQNVDPTSTDLNDRTGHGTAVTSIICGNRVTNFGAAPQAEVHVIKAYKKSTMKPEELLAALRAVPSNIDIVNISQAFSFSASLEEELVKYFNEHRNKVFVCSAGNDGIHQEVNNLPASISSKCENVIAVAALNEQGAVSTNFSVRSKHLTLAVPGEGINYANRFDPSKMYDGVGTSFASPIVTGLLALAKAFLQDNNKDSQAKTVADILKQTVTRKPQEELLYGLGILNPVEFSKKIKSISRV